MKATPLNQVHLIGAVATPPKWKDDIELGQVAYFRLVVPANGPDEAVWITVSCCEAQDVEDIMTWFKGQPVEVQGKFVQHRRARDRQAEIQVEASVIRRLS